MRRTARESDTESEVRAGLRTRPASETRISAETCHVGKVGRVRELHPGRDLPSMATVSQARAHQQRHHSAVARPVQLESMYTWRWRTGMEETGPVLSSTTSKVEASSQPPE
jgi:hypothetical protein